MELWLLTCASSAAIDQTSNRLSVFHILEEINAPSFPVPVPGFSVISLVSRTRSERANVSAELLITLGKKTLARAPWPLDFQTHLKTRNIGEINGLVIPAPGTLQFELRDKNKLIGEWRIQVTDIGEAQIVPQPALPAPEAKPTPRRGTAKPARAKRKRR